MEKKTVKRRPSASVRVEKKWTDQEVIDALTQSGGGIRDACRILEMATTTFYREWRYKPEIDAHLNMLWRIGAHNVIDTVYERALDGDIKACNLYMRYSPYVKEMGWVPEERVTLKTEKPLTPEEIEQAAKEIFG